jgi:hypothetical protein
MRPAADVPGPSTILRKSARFWIKSARFYVRFWIVFIEQSRFCTEITLCAAWRGMGIKSFSLLPDNTPGGIGR